MIIVAFRLVHLPRLKASAQRLQYGSHGFTIGSLITLVGAYFAAEGARLKSGRAAAGLHYRLRRPFGDRRGRQYDVAAERTREEVGAVVERRWISVPLG
jgi:hypothetical protein